MGKRQHQKDKMYLTYTEWSTLYGGKKAGTSEENEDTTFRRLPYDHCCLSLQPFQHPYCDPEGNIFELEAILDYIKRFKHNPVTGKPLDPKTLIKLNFCKNAEGQYHCPVLFKLFTKHSHIIWGKKFEDEFKPNLIHQGRGILSMANSGPNTNGSQFFITFRSCRHLDRKHTVFGKIVGGLETLNAIEKVEVDNKDRPIEDIIIQKAQFFVDPFQEADEQLTAEHAAEVVRLAQEAAKNKSFSKKEKNELKIYRSGVGKYIKMNKDEEKMEKTESNIEPVTKKKKLVTNSFNDFSSW
nr:RING-type E3 ubiquitin-protein ligase PPIL2-like [Nomia melanderi]